MAFVIYDTTKLIFKYNVSTTSDNVDNDTIIHVKSQEHINHSYFNRLNLEYNITIYANDGDLAFDGEEYTKECTKRFIDHIKSKQPDILICNVESPILKFIVAPMVIAISKGDSSYMINDKHIDIEFDNNCHCDNCCNCKYGSKYCIQKCERSIIHPCYSADNEILRSGRCHAMLDNIRASTMSISIVEFINKYMAENTYTTKSLSDSAVFLSDEQKKKLHELPDEYNYDGDRCISYKK